MKKNEKINLPDEYPHDEETADDISKCQLCGAPIEHKNKRVGFRSPISVCNNIYLDYFEVIIFIRGLSSNELVELCDKCTKKTLLKWLLSDI